MERGFYVQAKESAANARARRAQPGRRGRDRRLQQEGRQRVRQVPKDVRAWRRRAGGDVGGRRGRAVREAAEEEGRVAPPNRRPRTGRAQVQKPEAPAKAHVGGALRGSGDRTQASILLLAVLRDHLRGREVRRRNGALRSRGRAESVRRLELTSK